jgi:hypothetical protein
VESKLKQVIDRLELEQKLEGFIELTATTFEKFKGFVVREVEKLENKIGGVEKEVEQVKKQVDSTATQLSQETSLLASKTNEKIEGVESEVRAVDKDLQITKKDLNQKISKVKTIKGDDGYTPIKNVDYFDGKDGKDGRNGKNGVTKTIKEVVETKVPLLENDFEIIAEGLTNGIKLERKMTTKAIRDFREQTIEIARQVSPKFDGVKKIIAGTNISIDPEVGTGDVTINAEGVTTHNDLDGRDAEATHPAESIQYGDGNIAEILDNRVISVDGTTGAVDLSDSYEPKNSNIQSHITDLNNPHAVSASQIGAVTSTLLTDTKANILANTPTGTDPVIAFATDTLKFYLYDGTNWRVADIRLGASGTDMGYVTDSPRQGYHHEYITDKKLYNVVLQGFNGTAENGAIRINVAESPDTLEIYMRDEDWFTLIYDLTTEYGDFRHVPISEEIQIWKGDGVTMGLNGNPIVSEYQVDMGCNPTPRIIYGGAF